MSLCGARQSTTLCTLSYIFLPTFCRSELTRNSLLIKRMKACPSRNFFSGASHKTDKVPQNHFHSYGGCFEWRIVVDVHNAYRLGVWARWSNVCHGQTGVVKVVHLQRTAHPRQRPRMGVPNKGSIAPHQVSRYIGVHRSPPEGSCSL